jgi:[acyl-carrier-protein] S-malonyltransferase
MGQDFAQEPEAAAYFDAASGVLGYDLRKVCFEGPIEELTRSDRCQPAIFVVSACCYAAFGNRYAQVGFDAYAGLSLGEWSALFAAGVLDFESTVKVLEARGRFMQEACDANPGGMVSVMSLPLETVGKIAAECGLHISNINSQSQINLAGEKDRVEKAAAMAKEAGGKAIVLNVAGAFHSPFMQPAREKLAKVIADMKFARPKRPVFSNATGALHANDGEAIKAAMLDQVTGTVRWLDCILASEAHVFVEFGPGKVLSGLAKRIDRQNLVASVQDKASLEAIDGSDIFNALI